MSDWPVGISTGCFYQQSFFDIIEPVRNGGFTMIEVCSSSPHLDYHDNEGIREATAVMEKLGMEPYSFHAPFAEEIDITHPGKEEREYALNELLTAANAAATMNVRYFVTHPGPEKELDPGPEERVQRMRNAAAVIDHVARHCRKLGIGLVVENMLPHLFFGNMRDMLWIVGAIQNINIGTCLDTGHAAISGDIYRIIYKLSGHLRMIHANDNDHHSDQHVPPGEGKTHWRRLLSEINQTRFRGSLILELAGDTGKPVDEVLAGARKSRNYLRAIGKELELSSPPTVETAR